MDDAETDLIDLNLRLPRTIVEAAVRRGATPPHDPASRRLALAKWILASRRQRTRAFGSLRFGEPTWDMVLELYVADCEGRRVDVSGLCLASGVPATTALRYVDLLAAKSLVAKVDDVDDGRRAFVTISGELRSATEGWLDQADTDLGVAGWVGPSGATSDRDRAR